MQGEVDLVGVLDALVHRLGLPPRPVGVTTEVRHVVRRVRRLRAQVARLLRHLAAGLHAEFGRTGLAARVGGFDFKTESRVLETRYASLRITSTHVRLQLHG